MKPKFSKKEEKYLIGKEELLILVLPIRFIKNKRISKLQSKYDSILITFSKAVTTNVFYYRFNSYEKLTYLRYWELSRLYGEKSEKLYKEINSITGFNKAK